ncbi:PA14 domain-containing protein [uncultured Roseobacter sp.]|uniref:PA14 domain-containing protein n=1 Tax=uncultured Roseobacter sp. TaxID=114847 RepID=UPI0026383833|nr:PA14 domain-containing protein [uncultured Roseobacter sp.]
MATNQENQPGLLAEFFILDRADSEIKSLSEIDFTAPAAHTQVVDEVNYYGEDAFWDGGKGNLFAARFTADITVETAGTYTFSLNSDHGSQLSLGGNRIIDNDGDTDAVKQTVTLELEAGSHPIELLYYEIRGEQTLDLEWSGPDTGFEMVNINGSNTMTPSTATPPQDTTPQVQPEPGPAPVSQPEPEPAPEAAAQEVGFLAEFFVLDRGRSDITSLSEIDFDAPAAHKTVVDKVNYYGEEAFWDGGKGNLFAARFTSEITVEKAGTYTFSLNSDHGSQLTLDGNLVIDNDGLHDAVKQTVTLELEAGSHPIELLYYEIRGTQTLDLEWSGPDTGFEMVNIDGDSAIVPGSGGAEPKPTPGDEAKPGFLAEFFNIHDDDRDIKSLSEIDFSAPSVHEEVVSDLSYEGYDAFYDGGKGNFFAARFTADIKIEKAGTYTFNLNSDDGSQLSIGGKVVIDNDGLHDAITKTVTLKLEAGSYPIEVLYFEARGSQTLDLDWSGPDTEFEMVSLDSVVVPETKPDTDTDTDPDTKPDTDTDTDPDTKPDTDTDTDPDTKPDTDTDTDPEPTPPRLPTSDTGEGPVRVEAVEYSAGETVSVSGGRTTTLELNTAKQITSVEIVEGPAAGNATVNPDNSIAVVMTGTDHEGPLAVEYKTTYADGSTSTGTMKLDVQAPTQEAGWGMGQHYMLERDSDGDVVVETGDNHRKVYVSEDEKALTLSDIAAREGVAVGDIDGKWLMEHPEYGGSEDMALATDVGMTLWYELTADYQDPNSHWLLFEAGYEYTDLGKVTGRGAMGESELHPIHITSWGEGPAPVLDNTIAISQRPSENIVISNLEVHGGMGVKDSKNVLITDTDLVSDGLGIRSSEFVTLHDSSISYATIDFNDGSGVTQGLLGVDSTGLLLEGNVFHHNGWEDGYNMDGTGGAPDQFSHNVYLQWDTRDVTFRDNISSESSSVGAQLRGGAFAEDNLFLDNNVAVNFLGGNYKSFGHVGNFTYFADNVITSGAFKEAQSIGGQGWGTTNGGYESTMLDNIVAHLGDPDDPNGLDGKEVTRFATSQKENASYFYEDTKVLNWLASDPKRWKEDAMDRNLDDVDFDQAMQTTIQRYAAELTGGQTATIEGLMDYILSLSNTEYDDVVTASDIVNYFQSGFGQDLDNGSAVEEHRFIPNDLAGGVRWDNRINWDSEELPTDGDTVDLGSNWVQYGSLTSRIEDLDLGDGGKLAVTSGLLEVKGTLSTSGGDGHVSIDGAGQFWTNGFGDAGRLEVNIEGGRFANTGVVDGDVTIQVGDNGQAILATDDASMILSNGSELRIVGSDARVGFDGDSDGRAIMQMADNATLSFVADEDGFSTLGEFRSGYWDQSGSPVQSGISLDGTLNIDLSDYTGGVGTHELINVDALQGMFDEIVFVGLDDAYKARTVIDFETDTLMLEITNGNGDTANDIIGKPGQRGDEPWSMWDALRAGEGDFNSTSPLVLEEPELNFLF